MAPSAEEEVSRFLHPWSYPTGVQMYLWNECTLTFTSRSLEVFFSIYNYKLSKQGHFLY